MKSVDNHRYPAGKGRQSPEQASLSGVCMDDVGSERPDGPTDSHQSPQVVTDSHRATQGRNSTDWERRITQLDELGLTWLNITSQQQSLMVSQTTGQDANLPRRSTEVHPGDDPEDPDRGF
jgi:hypothetical protein